MEFGPEDRDPDVVFLHATGFNALTYASALAPLGETLRVLTVDQRGHGRSTLPADRAGRLDWLDFRDDLIALGEALELRRVVLAGHSMGATVAVMAAAAAPQLARRLVLFEPVIFPAEMRTAGGAAASPLVEGARRRRPVFSDRQAALQAYRGRGAFATWPEEMIADYVADGFRETPGGEVTLACQPSFEAAIFAFQGHDAWRALEQCRCPIDILRAELDSTFRTAGREGELTGDGRIRIETIAGASHFLPMERPQLVRDALARAAAAGET